MAKLFTCILFMTLLLGGCASPPRQELQAARLAVARAYASEAPLLAPLPYQAAERALREGEHRYRLRDYCEARQVLPRAESLARHASLKAGEEKSRIAEKEQQRIAKEEQRREEVRKAEERLRLQEEHARRSQSSQTPPPSKPKPAPAPLPPPTRYTVGEGETLWTIAGQGKVYSDALLWPLLYKANRDQIKDPRQIYPGQILNIPRDFTGEEEQEARAMARESDIFPVETLLPNPSPKPY
ncbi:MAG: hypothetical protein C0617_03090 [Desulfuromonas sp.]|uniref:LysM peptidoglycan-binding domain-containing protein n=1 Tax=Desulfuromonas sp. TaxID=892 RepID=UPI000CA8D8B2|nr:LysM peptidoglycan-binding domain-containing protein [Desulfuromonas sp.]PLX85683.1 MAG: hypothetical protein C0617_03090 [Desulfuromonas sp.]